MEGRFKIFTKEELEGMHLTVLRSIGREIGVKKPASVLKDQLVHDIILIQKGELEPEEPSKRGAPPKFFVDLSNYIDETYDEKYPDEQIPVPKIVMNDVSVENEMEQRENGEDLKNKDGDKIVQMGYFDKHPIGYGFVRVNKYDNSVKDIYVSAQNVRKFDIRSGDFVECEAKCVREKDTPALQRLISLNGIAPNLCKNRSDFDELVPYYPTRKLKLETPDQENDLALRCIDLFSPLGMGQRALIVAPPKTGKTTLLKNIAQAIERNHKDVKLFIMLIDERPEEVTDISRSVKSEVVFSTFDETPEHHVRVAERVISRAKRFVEVGVDVVVLLDSITRLTRAYNNTVDSSGKILSGGLDPKALNGPKHIFGSARNIENGGSLTIISTALIETGSKMDDVIYEEFKGTGNMEIHLSRELAERRVFPAIDIIKSGTRKEELLLTQKEIDTSYKLRKLLSDKGILVENVLEMIAKTKDNEDLLGKVDAWLKIYQK